MFHTETQTNIHQHATHINTACTHTGRRHTTHAYNQAASNTHEGNTHRVRRHNHRVYMGRQATTHAPTQADGQQAGIHTYQEAYWQTRRLAWGRTYIHTLGLVHAQATIQAGTHTIQSANAGEAAYRHTARTNTRRGRHAGAQGGMGGTQWTCIHTCIHTYMRTQNCTNSLCYRQSTTGNHIPINSAIIARIMCV